MKRKGFFSRLADKLFGGRKKAPRRARKQKAPPTPPPPPTPPVIIGSDVEVEARTNYTLTGWRVEGGEWQDVEKGAGLPGPNQWIRIDLVTVNLAPDNPEGFYRSARVLGGFDGEPDYYYDEANLSREGYTLDDLAYELALEYGFAVQ